MRSVRYRVALAVFSFLLACSSASAQTTLNLSHDLVPLGIAGTNLTPNQPSPDAGPLLYQAVEYAKQHGILWSSPIRVRITF